MSKREITEGQAALLRSLAAVCNEQTGGWPIQELAEVLGWLVASAAVTHAPAHRQQQQFIAYAHGCAKAAHRSKHRLEDRRQ